MCLATNSARKLKPAGGILDTRGILENPDRSLRFGFARTPLDQGMRQASAVHYNGVHYSAVHYIAVHNRAVHYSAVQYSAEQCIVIHCSAVYCTFLQRECDVVHWTDRLKYVAILLMLRADFLNVDSLGQENKP